MKRWKDPFPRTPKGFHDRVEQTLGGLEDTEMRYDRKHRRLSIALVAALIAILATAAVAVAVVLGNSRFKQALTDSGADEVAELVQEVHVPATGGEAEGFALSIDEIIWEDDKLYFTYTASVPDDGNSYLLALYTPLLNGEPMAFHTTNGWFETSTFFDGGDQYAIPLGGARPACCGQLLTFRVNPKLRQSAANALFLRADFFRTDVGFTGDMDDTGDPFKGAVPTLYLSWDAWDDPDSLEEYIGRTRLADGEAEMLRAVAEAAGEDGILTPEELAAVEGIEAAARREVRMAVDASKLAQTVYDGVEQTEFALEDWNGCTLTVEEFHMTHLGASFRLRVTAPAGLPEEEGMRLASSVAFPGELHESYSWSVFRPDGSALALGQGWGGNAGYRLQPDGRASYGLNYDVRGIIPLEGLDKVILMPRRPRPDGKGKLVDEYLEDWALELTPILSQPQAVAEPLQTLSPEAQADLDRFMNGEVMTRQERQVAAAHWKEGDPTVTVYATKGGQYFHVDSECSGMRGAIPWAIEDAVQDGKRACPDCVGGPNAPEETVESWFTGVGNWGPAE